MFKQVIFIGLAFLGLLLPAQAQVPAPLKGWEEWAAAPFSYRECAIKPAAPGAGKDEYVCQWPGKLDMRLTATSGSFRQSWILEQKGSVPLPGSVDHWPQEVRVDGLAAPVVDRDGVPYVALLPGSHVISGVWSWEKMPSQLAIPAQTAWWSIDRAGQGSVRRQGSALLFEDVAVSSETKPSTRDTLNVRVFRKFTDGQAVQMDVQLELNVGGAPREVELGPVVDPLQWLPMSVDSAWPVQWQSSGRLRVQVQPGSGVIGLRLRCVARCDQAFSRLPATDPWPKVEYWALQSDPSFRVVAWEGDAVDPRQISAPTQWQSLPWVQVKSEGSAKWVVKSKGPTEKDAPMTLSRQAWLDFDGKGWWLKDTIQGPTPRAYRLQSVSPYEVVSATSAGQALLVSTNAKQTGVEWRQPLVAVDMLLRQPKSHQAIPIPGISGEFSQVDWTLHLPPAHRVLFAPGADRSSQVWATRWRLTQVLGAAILLLLSWRWGGVKLFAPSFVLVLLAYHTPGMPIWSWGVVLGLGLLKDAGLPEKLRKVAVGAWLCALVMWLLFAASFSVSQVKKAMYPQWAESGQSMSANAEVEGVYYQIGSDAGAAASSANAMDQAARQVMEAAPASAPSPMMSREKAMPVAPPPPPVMIEENGARISAGQGAPKWQSSAPVRLSWQGPITEKDTVKLWIVGPFLVRFGAWLSVALLLAVGWLLVRRPQTPTKPRGFSLPWKNTLVASLLCLCLPTLAQAAVPVRVPGSMDTGPGQEWLDRIGQEKHPIPSCAPNCISIAAAAISVAEGQMVIDMEAHAQARAALPLPVDADEALVLVLVKQDGQTMPAVLQEGDQKWLLLQKGVSRVQLRYSARSVSGTLKFPQNPGRVEIAAQGWSFSGLDKGRLSSGVLGWQKTAPAAATPSADAVEEKAALPVSPFVIIHRHVVFGPKWEAHVKIERVAPIDGAFVVHVPLLPGEQPRQDLPRDDKGLVIASFQQGQGEVSWSSDLPAKTPMLLTAEQSKSFTEQWVLTPGNRFRVSVDGALPLANNVWNFHPLPGEKITISVSEPAPVSGSTVAVDDASLEQQWGPRGQSIDLIFQTRATTASDLVLFVPKDLELESITRAGAVVPGVKVEDGKLLLPAPPGPTSWKLSFRNNHPPSLRVASPQLKFDAPVSNVTVAHVPGEKRWVLNTLGPGQAPAVAYWPWLVVLLLLAFVAGKWRKSPLKTWQWVLLGLGFSVAAPWKIAIVGAWLVALNQRERHSGSLHQSPLFNVAQVGLVCLTVLAVATIVGALPESLLGRPDMKIYGEQAGRLPWFFDQVKANQAWPEAVVISVPMWIYRVLMLSWSLWLAISALNWLRDGLKAWLMDGHWKHTPKIQASSNTRPPDPRAPDEPHEK